jgi:type VII secretion-associated protein (TIGR03931 family)
MDRPAMTGIVVEVGPARIRGPHHVDAERVSAGLDGIDDELALIDGCPVAVADVWRSVMRDVVGGSAESVTLVCPTWWASARVDRVREAASTVANDVVVLRRAQVLRDGLSDPLLTVVEIAPEFVVVSSCRGDIEVAVRGDADAVVAGVGSSMAVVVDGPEGVEGSSPLAAGIADRLRANGVAVTVADPEWVWRSAQAPPSQAGARGTETRPSTNRGGRARAVLAGALLSAAVLYGGLAAEHDVQPPVASVPMTLLVEGRVGVMVPAQWVVRRITSGPGSARVQVISPYDADNALHITQSSLAPRQSHEQVAESLRSALSEEPDGVFAEFNPSDHRADQAVVTYREIRAKHHIEWVVFIDQSLRIAIGCQSAPGRDESVRDACDQAIRSAHAVF